jgi:hypothetical protein
MPSPITPVKAASGDVATRILGAILFLIQNVCYSSFCGRFELAVTEAHGEGGEGEGAPAPVTFEAQCDTGKDFLFESAVIH